MYPFCALVSYKRTNKMIQRKGFKHTTKHMHPLLKKKTSNNGKKAPRE